MTVDLEHLRDNSCASKFCIYDARETYLRV